MNYVEQVDLCSLYLDSHLNARYTNLLRSQYSFKKVSPSSLLDDKYNSVKWWKKPLVIESYLTICFHKTTVVCMCGCNNINFCRASCSVSGDVQVG